MITKNGVLKLADFGLARAFSDFNVTKNKYEIKITMYLNYLYLILFSCLLFSNKIMVKTWNVRQILIFLLFRHDKTFIVFRTCLSNEIETWNFLLFIDFSGRFWIQFIFDSHKCSKLWYNVHHKFIFYYFGSFKLPVSRTCTNF